MGKHLIYLGYTGAAHRIALFDADNIPIRKVPVKDTSELPDAPMLNCVLTKNGRIQPSLMGAHSLITCPKTSIPMIDSYAEDKNFDFKRLWVNRAKKPGFHYYIREAREGIQPFYPGALLNWCYAFNIWDGTCKENNIYVLAYVLQKMTEGHVLRYAGTPSVLCLNHEGEVILLRHTEMYALYNLGYSFIQTGTPALNSDYGAGWQQTVTYGKSSLEGHVPAVTYGHNQDCILWHERRGKHLPTDLTAVEAVWAGEELKSTIKDFRRFPNAKVFGMNSVGDAAAIIYPESTKVIWINLTVKCISLRAIYIPASVEVIHKGVLTAQKSKKFTIYSDSLVAHDFALKHGIKIVPCASADEFLNVHYTPSHADYIDVIDAGNIATLAGVESTQKGESGVVLSAVLMSCAVKGFAVEELQKRYPVTPILDEKLPDFGYLPSLTRSNIIIDERTEDLVRLFVATLTLFYPYKKIDFVESYTWKQIKLGSYVLYYTPQQMHLRPLHAMLVNDVTQRVIHTFDFDDYQLGAVLNYLESICVSGDEPRGVLRYADKLRALSLGNSEQSDYIEIRKSLFISMFPVLYNTQISKRQLLGIDLHTGAFVTADYTQIQYSGNHDVWPTIEKSPRHVARWYPLISKMLNIKLHAADSNIKHVFPNGCKYKEL